MEPTDITIQILTDIRDQARLTNERLDQTNTRLDRMNDRIDGTNERLETMREELSRRIVESEIRTSTAITELAGTVRDMTHVLRASHDVRPRLERCEKDIADLRRRIGER
jgi:predicted RNase H-like nuclease (RuvC/YqgF family)